MLKLGLCVPTHHSPLPLPLRLQLIQPIRILQRVLVPQLRPLALRAFSEVSHLHNLRQQLLIDPISLRRSVEIAVSNVVFALNAFVVQIIHALVVVLLQERPLHMLLLLLSHARLLQSSIFLRQFLVRHLLAPFLLRFLLFLALPAGFYLLPLLLLLSCPHDPSELALLPRLDLRLVLQIVGIVRNFFQRVRILALLRVLLLLQLAKILLQDHFLRLESIDRDRATCS